MAVNLSALLTRLTLLPRNIIIFTFLVIISIRGWVNHIREDRTELYTLRGLRPICLLHFAAYVFQNCINAIKFKNSAQRGVSVTLIYRVCNGDIEMKLSL
jgi:hypothetical protein